MYFNKERSVNPKIVVFLFAFIILPMQQRLRMRPFNNKSNNNSLWVDGIGKENTTIV